MPSTPQGLTSLANEKIEEAMRNGAFRDVRRGPPPTSTNGTPTWWLGFTGTARPSARQYRGRGGK
ncbi:hypothetical protein KEM52_000912 [Ascosphaera acerosa]|nr:hypothetical protein KEM52_000912 [Ascosphaera acerosa]